MDACFGGGELRAYLGGGNSPDLVVVGTHEDVGNTLTGHTQNPLVEVLGLGVGNTALEGRVNETVNALDLVIFGEHGDVVLEGVGNPETLVANVGDTLVGVPVLLLGESLLNNVVEVLVVGEDDVTADIVELEDGELAWLRRQWTSRRDEDLRNPRG